MAQDYDARQWLTYAPPPDPTRYKANFGQYADEALKYMNERGGKAKEEEFRNAQLQRETGRDVRNDERERVGQRQRAEEMMRNDRRAGQREDLYALSENRRERVDQLNRQHLKQAEHEKLIQDLYNASNTGDPRAVQFAIDALTRAGYPVEEMQHTAAMPEAPAAPASTAAAPEPMSQADAQTSAQLDQAEQRIIPKLTGGTKPKAQPGRDAALSHQLDDIDTKYTKGLSGSSVSPWLPGRSPIRRSQSVDVTQSDAMLDPDDPYNQIVK